MQLNTQPPEKVAINDGMFLAVNSIFWTFQGEGPFVGRPAVFIRLAGCNLQCPNCDTEYTNRISLGVGAILMKVHQLSEEARKNNPNDKILIVITGGEPFRQNLRPLIDLILSTGKYTVQIETNGTLYQDLPENVFIVCSPKTGNVHKSLAPRINAFKYVVDIETGVDEFGFPVKALGHPNSGSIYKPPPELKYVDIYIQAADSKDENINALNLELAMKVCQQYNRLLCIQTHKIINVE